jgi:hypothetical protein
VLTPDDAHAYVAEINLGAHLERPPDDLGAQFVDDVIRRLGGPEITVDYVRVNIDAVA